MIGDRENMSKVKRHVRVEYGLIKTNYAMYLAITPVISTETLE